MIPSKSENTQCTYSETQAVIKVKDRMLKAWERCGGHEKERSHGVSRWEERWDKREKSVKTGRRKSLMAILILRLMFPKWHCWTIKCCSASPFTLPCVLHRSGCDSLTPIVTLTVCCGVLLIKAYCCQPLSHMLTGGAQKEAERKWHLKFGENRGTKRPLMKSIAEFKRDWKRLHYFISKTFFVLSLWCK